jgi:hypothetical protein
MSVANGKQLKHNNSIFCTWIEITPFSGCNVHVGKNIGLGICAWDEITPKNLVRFWTSIKYLIILFSIITLLLHNFAKILTWRHERINVAIKQNATMEYEFGLSLCKIVRRSVILLLPLLDLWIYAPRYRLIIWLPNLSILRVTDDGYSRMHRTPTNVHI